MSRSKWRLSSFKMRFVISRNTADAESRMKQGSNQQCMGVSGFQRLVTLEIPVWHDDGSHLALSASYSVGSLLSSHSVNTSTLWSKNWRKSRWLLMHSLAVVKAECSDVEENKEEKVVLIKNHSCNTITSAFLCSAMTFLLNSWMFWTGWNPDLGWKIWSFIMLLCTHHGTLL